MCVCVCVCEEIKTLKVGLEVIEAFLKIVIHKT